MFHVNKLKYCYFSACIFRSQNSFISYFCILIVNKLWFVFADLARTSWLGANEDSQRRDKWAQRFLQHHLPSAQGRHQNHQQQHRLMESAVVLTIDDLVMTCVITLNNQRSKRREPFFSSDKRLLKLPKDMNTVYVDFTEYYSSNGATSTGGSWAKTAHAAFDLGQWVRFLCVTAVG